MGSDVIALLGVLRIKGVNWNYVARSAQRPDGLARLLAGEEVERSNDAFVGAELIRRGVGSRSRREADVERMLEETLTDGVRLATVLDDSYPVNLREIYNLPPFLFYRGELLADDVRSVAVVGTREASSEGLKRTEQMARLLVANGVTVLSGLARGIDTRAHEACLEAGGRTIAVLGSGIRRIYPPENSELVERIIDGHGAVVSQFWPQTAPSSYTFPRRNVVTSGLGQGTVVIEASATSGAKMQARLALDHGKQVFLLRSLVDNYEWARRYAERRGAVIVDGVEDVVQRLRSPEAVLERATVTRQLALHL